MPRASSLASHVCRLFFRALLEAACRRTGFLAHCFVLRRKLPATSAERCGSTWRERTCLSGPLQVEIERRYAAVLHHTVKRMMEGAMPLLAKLLMPQMPEDVSLSMQAEPLVSNLSYLILSWGQPLCIQKAAGLIARIQLSLCARSADVSLCVSFKLISRA